MWVVRTFLGSLIVSDSKPTRVGCAWCAVNMMEYYDEKNQFSDLKYEDEPIEVELVRK